MDNKVFVIGGMDNVNATELLRKHLEKDTEVVFINDVKDIPVTDTSNGISLTPYVKQFEEEAIQTITRYSEQDKVPKCKLKHHQYLKVSSEWVCSCGKKLN